MQLGFGSGILVGTPTIDVNGAAVTNPTPTEFGLLQDCSVDFDFDLKQLFGSYQYPVAIGRGKGKITGKAKFAQINGLMLNNLVFGASYASLLIGEVKDFTGSTIPAGTPYYLNPTPPNSGTWILDQGVTYAGGRSLIRVASAPAVGQYALVGPVTGATASFATNVMTVTVAGSTSFAVGQVITSVGVAAGTYITSLGTGTGGTGTYNLSTSPGTITAQAVSASVVYTFAAADAGRLVYLSYQYSAASTVAKRITIPNSLMGAAPQFRADLFIPYQGQNFVLTLGACVADKLSFASKLDDFTVPEFDFMAFADSLNNIAYLSVAE
jgi:hypothetical protein